MTNNETHIRKLLDTFTCAVRNKNAADVIATISNDVDTFDLAPLLRQGPDKARNPALLEEWFDTWKSPILSESYEFANNAAGDLAYGFGLQRMAGTKTDDEKVDLWFRTTVCFRRQNSHYRITHMHNSVPFAMDGSEKALLDLKPYGRKIRAFLTR